MGRYLGSVLLLGGSRPSRLAGFSGHRHLPVLHGPPFIPYGAQSGDGRTVGDQQHATLAVKQHDWATLSGDNGDDGRSRFVCQVVCWLYIYILIISEY